MTQATEPSRRRPRYYAMKILSCRGELPSRWAIVSGPYYCLSIAWRAALEHRRAADGFYVAGEMGSPQDGAI